VSVKTNKHDETKQYFNVFVTEFVRPNGKQVAVNVHVRDQSLAVKYAEINDNKLRFTLEHLRNGVANVCLEDETDDFMSALIPSEYWDDAIPSLLKDFDVLEYLSFKELVS